MRRRTLLEMLAAMPFLHGRARAQQPERVRRIGVLSSFLPSDRERYEPMIAALRERGYAEGRNVAFVYRFGNGDPAIMAQQAAELVRMPADIIIAIATPAGHAAKAATQTIPIVFSTADPLASGLVTSLARPGGNLTGISTVAADLTGKQLELLREIIPDGRRVAFLGAAQDQNTGNFQRQYEAAAAQLGMGLDTLLVAGPGEFEAAFARAAAARVAAVVVQPIFVSARDRIAEQAMRHRLPWFGDNSEFGAAGALFAFGADRVALWQRTGVQAARVLDGAAAGDIPVEQPTRFNLVVNLRAARALGVTVPPSVLLRADEVVE